MDFGIIRTGRKSETIESKFKSRRILEKAFEQLDRLPVFGYNKEGMSLIEYGSAMGIIAPAMDDLCNLAEYWEEKAKSPPVTNNEKEAVE